MTLEDFIKSVKQDSLAPKTPPLLVALWHDAKEDWHAAHEIAQSKEGTQSYDRLHAYLHRKEGDDWNADYWYRRCGEASQIKEMRKISLSDEWYLLAKRFSEDK